MGGRGKLEETKGGGRSQERKRKGDYCEISEPQTFNTELR